jgi:hypothetical protein
MKALGGDEREGRYLWDQRDVLLFEHDKSHLTVGCLAHGAYWMDVE